MIKFQPVFVQGINLDDVWFQLLYQLKMHGREYKITDGSYAGQKRLTFDFVSGFIEFPHSRPLAPQVPESSSLPPPTDDHNIEQYFANYLMNSDLAKNEHYRYATWIVGGEYKVPAMWTGDHPEIGSIIDENVDIKVPNQTQWIIKHFQEKGWGNEHCYMTIGYPESNFAYDQEYSNEMERGTSPCLRGLDFRIVDGHLLTHVVYRSWDLVAGWPENMGGFTLLNEYMAQEIGCEPGPLSFSCKSLHAYDHALEYLNQRVGKI